MLKYAFLAGAMTLAAPAFAQETAPQGLPQASPSTTGTAVTTAPADMAPTATPAPVPQDTAAATPPAAAEDAATDTAAAASTGQDGGATTQVAGVVKTEFPTYDKDSSGTLNDAEFADWMGKLRKASEPQLDTASAEVKTWMKSAFTQADTDKNKAVSETELTGFLSAAQAS